MESYLVDPAVLGPIVDELIKQKYPNQPASASIKKEAMLALDHQILKSVLGSLTKEQGQELNALLNKDKNDSFAPEVYEKFFTDHHIDLGSAIQKAMVDFKNSFLKGGQNA